MWNHVDFRKALRQLEKSINKTNSLTLVETSKSAGFITLYFQFWKQDKPQTLPLVTAALMHKMNTVQERFQQFKTYSRPEDQFCTASKGCDQGPVKQAWQSRVPQPFSWALTRSSNLLAEGGSPSLSSAEDWVYLLATCGYFWNAGDLSLKNSLQKFILPWKREAKNKTFNNLLWNTLIQGNKKSKAPSFRQPWLIPGSTACHCPLQMLLQTSLVAQTFHMQPFPAVHICIFSVALKVLKPLCT